MKMKKTVSVILAAAFFLLTALMTGCGENNSYNCFDGVDFSESDKINSPTGSFWCTDGMLFGVISTMSKSKLYCITKDGTRDIFEQSADSDTNTSYIMGCHCFAYGDFWFSAECGDMTKIYKYDTKSGETSKKYELKDVGEFGIIDDSVVYTNYDLDLMVCNESGDQYVICDNVESFGVTQNKVMYAVSTNNALIYRYYDTQTGTDGDIIKIKNAENAWLTSYYGQKHIITSSDESQKLLVYNTESCEGSTFETSYDGIDSICIFSDCAFVTETDYEESCEHIYRIDLNTLETEHVTDVEGTYFVMTRAISDDTLVFCANDGWYGRMRVYSVTVGSDPVLEYEYRGLMKPY